MIRKELSLRGQILLLFVLLAIIMASVLSLQSARFFLKSFEFSERSTMRHLAQEVELTNGNPTRMLGYHIASRWSDVPDSIKEVFPDVPTQTNVLYRHFEDWNYFTPPRIIYQVMKTTNAFDETRFVSQYHVNQDVEAIRIRDGQIWVDPMVEIALWGIGTTAAIFVIVLIALRLFATPVESLHRW
ncbi:MAG: hypothetical protein MI754_10430, partial [Chromatiales bacterium]|nr:hypothetical protein [Chromatiales bacterium]